MVTCIIDAMEGRKVAVANISGSFIHTDMVHGYLIVCVRLCGVLVDFLVKLYPEKFAYKFVLEGR